MMNTIFSRKSVIMFAAWAVFIISTSLLNSPVISPKNALAKDTISSQASMPKKVGLAALYPGDEGIERDPRVLFVDDFETGTPEDIGARWGSISKKENIKLSDDIHTNSPGNRSIHISKNGHIFTHTKGVDTMYARFYVKFHEKTGYVHHFVHLVADRTPTPWPKGGAGETPPGAARSPADDDSRSAARQA